MDNTYLLSWKGFHPEMIAHFAQYNWHSAHMACESMQVCTCVLTSQLHSRLSMDRDSLHSTSQFPPSLAQGLAHKVEFLMNIGGLAESYKPSALLRDSGDMFRGEIKKNFKERGKYQNMNLLNIQHPRLIVQLCCYFGVYLT